MILESTLLTNFDSYIHYFNPIALNDRVCFLQVNEDKEAKSYSYKLRLNSFDLEEEKLQENPQEVEVSFDKQLAGIKLVVPQSASIEMPKIFASLFFFDCSA